LIATDLGLALSMLAGSILAGLLCTGSRGRRLLGLLAGASTLVPPWFASPSIVRGLFCLGAAMAAMRAVDLFRDRRFYPAARRIGHMLSPVDSRLLHDAPSSFDGKAFAVALAWLAASGAGLWIASLAGRVAVPADWIVRWLGGLLWVYGFVAALWAGLGGFYRLVGFTTPALHRNPIASRSVRELWGERWSLSVGRWLDANLFKPFARWGHPRVGLVAAFFASAALHAYAVLCGIGTAMALVMLAYFLVQGLLVLLERLLGVQRWSHAAAHAWLLSVMILTSPLFVEPALQTLGVASGR
jgi:hypothetical protein